MTQRRVVTFGTFDVFHYGHLRLLERARQLGDYLCVGVSTDQFSFRKKGTWPVFPEDQRARIVGALRVVDRVFMEESMEAKREYLLAERAAVLVMGDDWQGRFDGFRDICEVVYLARTPAISTTAVIERIRE